MKIRDLFYANKSYIRVASEDWFVNFDESKLYWEEFNQLKWSMIRSTGKNRKRWYYWSRLDNKWLSFARGKDNGNELNHNPELNKAYNHWRQVHGNH